MAENETTLITKTRVADIYGMEYNSTIDKVVLDFGTFTITVVRRTGDWMAYLNGHTGVWCCGKSPDYVIGYCIMTLIHEQQIVAGLIYTDLHNYSAFIENSKSILVIEREE